jgi:hypothetical protein
MPPSITYRWRRGGGWDLVHEQERVDSWGCDPFTLWVLRAVQDGRERCGGCHRVFPDTSAVALITECVRFNPPQVDVVAYCLPCARTHAEAIADLSGDTVVH